MDEKTKAMLGALSASGIAVSKRLLVELGTLRGPGPWFETLRTELLRDAKMAITESMSDAADWTVTLAAQGFVEMLFTTANEELDAIWAENKSDITKLN